MMKKHHFAIIVIMFIHILVCFFVVIFPGKSSGFMPDFPFYLLYFASLPLATTVAGLIDMFLGLFIKNTICRWISIASGAVSFGVLLLSLRIDFGFLNCVSPFTLSVIGAVVIWACWVLRGIVYHNTKN